MSISFKKLIQVQANDRTGLAMAIRRSKVSSLAQLLRRRLRLRWEDPGGVVPLLRSNDEACPEKPDHLTYLNPRRKRCWH
jgi:hypothetical protein